MQAHQTEASHTLQPPVCKPCLTAPLHHTMSPLLSPLCSLPGGSAANVCKGLAGMAQHMRCSFIGMVGSDSTGAEYSEALLLQGVEPALLVGVHVKKKQHHENIARAGHREMGQSVHRVDQCDIRNRLGSHQYLNL